MWDPDSQQEALIMALAIKSVKEIYGTMGGMLIEQTTTPELEEVIMGADQPWGSQEEVE